MAIPKPLVRAATVALIVVLAACSRPPAPPTDGTAAPPSPTASAAASPSPSSAPSATPSPPTAGRVEAAAPMLRARVGFDAVVLGDGTVLAVGDDQACLPGPAEPGSETAERYDPAIDRWSEAASLNKPRKSFAMVGLLDGGAIVVGGTNPTDQLYSSTKVFDEVAGTWSDGPLLEVARGDPAAALLADGRVIVGSETVVGETSSTTTTELLDATRTAWSNGRPIEGYAIHTFVPLSDGRVMGIGSSFEIELALVLFDPATGRWAPAELPHVIRQPRILAVDGGDALAFGYEDTGDSRSPTVRVERFHGASGAWSDLPPMAIAREGAILTHVGGGRVLVAGGAVVEADGVGVAAVTSTEVYDPEADAWRAGPELLEPRKDGGSEVLSDGSVLILGGDADFNTEGDVPWCPSPLQSTERVYLEG
jgi:hypothetical protein